MKMKILSPAGDMESLKQAIYNGADEVYLGIKDFNARNNIAGFDLTTLKEAVDFAHIYDVRVFLAVNILFDNYEIIPALNLIVDAYNIGVDAFIIQDFGLINLLHENYPEIEIHASTQMGIHNLEGVKAIEKFVKRVVLARETPLEEIKRIKENSNVEIEYFVQGALCVSFSGNCYLSSYECDASGNRGKCKQLCRLPYILKNGNKKIKEGYLLSAKDFNMLNRLQDLQDAGVDSLKIEGRARRPYYVGTATKIYRKAVDNLKISNQDNIELQLAFNRGYTEGYFNGNNNITSNLQNHIGIQIGKVEKVNLGKKFNEIYISSNYNLTPKSTLKFYNNNSEVATISAFDLTKQNDLYKITTTQKVNIGDKVNLISDFELENKLLNSKSKRNLKIRITAKENYEISASINLNNKEIIITGPVCQTAKSAPLTKTELENNFNKNEYFSPIITAEIENVFIQKQQLNEFRRNVYSVIVEELTKLKHSKLAKKKIEKQTLKVEKLENVQILHKNFEDLNSHYVIYSPETYNQRDIADLLDYCKPGNNYPILNLPNFATQKDIELLKNIVEELQIPVIVNNYYALNFNTKKFAGGGLNIYNTYSANYFNLPYLTAENEQTIKMPYMTVRHCPMKEHLSANCANCPYNENYTYTMPNGKTMKLKRIRMSTCTFYLT